MRKGANLLGTLAILCLSLFFLLSLSACTVCLEIRDSSHPGCVYPTTTANQQITVASPSAPVENHLPPTTPEMAIFPGAPSVTILEPFENGLARFTSVVSLSCGAEGETGLSVSYDLTQGGSAGQIYDFTSMDEQCWDIQGATNMILRMSSSENPQGFEVQLKDRAFHDSARIQIPLAQVDTGTGPVSIPLTRFGVNDPCITQLTISVNQTHGQGDLCIHSISFQ